MVFKSTYKPLKAPVAVKIIDLTRLTFVGKELERMREEIRIMERVSHVRAL